jgi:hypothetical protein
MPPIYAPERVARAVVSCARRPRRIVKVGAMPRVMRLNRLLMPAVYERVQPRLVERMHLGSLAAEPSRGALDAPLEPHRVDGGWKRARRRRTTGLAALGALASLVMLGVAVR